MLLIEEKSTRGGISQSIDRYAKDNNKYMKDYCQSIDRYAKDNNKYMKNYDKNKDSSYL